MTTKSWSVILITLFCAVAFAQTTTATLTGKEQQLNKDAVLLFTYDGAGNQTQRLYCDNPDCKTSFTDALAEKVVSTEIKEDKKETLTEKGLQVYPNPVHNIVTISFNTTLLKQVSTMKMYNVAGVLISQPNHTGLNTLQVNLQQLPSGVYFLHIHLKNAKSITRKIIKN